MGHPLSEQQVWILNYVGLSEMPVSPTEIGEAARKASFHTRQSGSAWASPKCLRLVERGYLRRTEEGHYWMPRGPEAK